MHPDPSHRPPGPNTAKGRRKMSRAVSVTVVGVVSLLVVAYCAAQDEDDVTADCVDIDSLGDDGGYQAVDEDYCDDDGYHGRYGAYRWYYGGVLSGARVSGGTTVRPSDAQIVSRGGSVIQRGGFGGRGSGGG